MYTIKPTSKFKKDLRAIHRSGYYLQLLSRVIEMLAKAKLPPKYKNHPLQENYKSCRECHITPDRLLIYEINKETLILYLTNHKNCSKIKVARERL